MHAMKRICIRARTMQATCLTMLPVLFEATLSILMYKSCAFSEDFGACFVYVFLRFADTPKIAFDS